MSTFDRIQFGNRLKEMRIAAGFMRQIDLAEKIGTIVQTISNYEKGIRLPDAEMLSRIVEVLPCNADYLLGFEVKPTYSTAYIAEETGLSDSAILKLVESKRSDSNSEEEKQTSACDLLSYFITSKQLEKIIKLHNDYVDYLHIQGQNNEILASQINK